MVSSLAYECSCFLVLVDDDGDETSFENVVHYAQWLFVGPRWIWQDTPRILHWCACYTSMLHSVVATLK